MIRFLLKFFLLMALLLLILSFWAPGIGHNQQLVNSDEAIAAVKGSFFDFSHFCERNPHVCEVGKNLYNTVGDRLAAGAHVLYNYLSHYFAD